MCTGFKSIFFAGTSDECNIVNSFTPQKATEIPKIYLAIFFLFQFNIFSMERKPILNCKP